MQNLSNATTKIQLNSISEKKTSKRKTFFSYLRNARSDREEEKLTRYFILNLPSQSPRVKRSCFPISCASFPSCRFRLFHLFISRVSKFLLHCWDSARGCEGRIVPTFPWCLYAEMRTQREKGTKRVTKGETYNEMYHKHVTESFRHQIFADLHTENETKKQRLPAIVAQVKVISSNKHKRHHVLLSRHSIRRLRLAERFEFRGVALHAAAN